MNIILMGMKHCGKTTVGERLARELGLPFYDLDELILSEEGTGTIEEFHRSVEPEEFNRREAEAFGSVCGAPEASAGFVLALGGRAPLNPLLSGALEQCGVLVYINTPFNVIFGRVMAKGTSALIHDRDPGGHLRRVFDERRPVYRSRARLVVDGGGGPEEIAARIKAGIKEFANGGQ